MLRCGFMIIAIFVMINQIQAQKGEEVLMRVGNTPVTVSEFKYVYEKNNGNNADYSAKSVEEYLDLYTKFKIKVEKAKLLKMDTIVALQKELEGYRKQLANSYLIDKGVTDFLLQELFDRTKYDIEFSHIFIPVNEKSTLKEKEIAKQTIGQLYERLQRGDKFEKVAQEGSQDKNSAQSGGYMGWITAKLPDGFYELENAVYKTEIGKFSNIIQSKIGYHIVKPLKKRDAFGIIEVAHILIKPDNKKLADSLYSELISGKDFDVIAFNYSIDKASLKNNGKLPPFGINTYDRVFEDAAFAIGKDGEYSKPVMSKTGWHIIKRIGKQTPDPFPLFVRKMKTQINKDSRFKAATIKLVDNIKKEANFSEDKKLLNDISSKLDDSFHTYKWSISKNLFDTTQTLFTLGKNKYSIIKFLEYCKGNTKTRLKYDNLQPKSEIVNELYNEFVQESVLQYEEQNLEQKYPDFKSLMREYEEGILLFEATKVHVWDKANQDTVGLNAYYNAHKGQYVWEENATVTDIVLLTTSEKEAKKMHDFIVNEGLENALIKFNRKETLIKFADHFIEKNGKDDKTIVWKVGSATKPVVDITNNNYVFSLVKKIDLQRQKSLSDARGYVVADYQEQLEKDWIDSLFKEISVAKNQDVIKALYK